MLEIQCVKCGEKFNVVGYITPDTYSEPGEVVTELECDDPLCECLNDGGEFEVLSEGDTYLDDDVI